MKKVLSLITVSLLALNSVSAQSVTTPTLEPVECSTEKIFSDNTCQVCFTGGEATPDTKGILLPLGDVPWENALDGINQNFYQTGQTKAEIKTNIGTPAATWDEKGLTWAKDVIWKDLDGLQMFSLDAAKTINIKSIEKDTLLPLTAMKQVENPFVVIKIPISYYELKM